MSATEKPTSVQVHILDHPFALNALAHLRDGNTSVPEFRERARELAKYLVLEATRDLPLREVTIETPVAKTVGKVLAGNRIIVVPILRAGLAMVEAVMELLPEAEVRHVGLARNEKTLQPEPYYVNLPDWLEPDTIVMIIDPMLATGGSAIATVQLFKDRGATDIKFLSLIAAPEGVEAFLLAHPDVPLYTVSVDDRLDAEGYIVPGLGDAGDRTFGTF